MVSCSVCETNCLKTKKVKGFGNVHVCNSCDVRGLLSASKLAKSKRKRRANLTEDQWDEYREYFGQLKKAVANSNATEWIKIMKIASKKENERKNPRRQRILQRKQAVCSVCKCNSEDFQMIRHPIDQNNFWCSSCRFVSKHCTFQDKIEFDEFNNIVLEEKKRRQLYEKNRKEKKQERDALGCFFKQNFHCNSRVSKLKLESQSILICKDCFYSYRLLKNDIQFNSADFENKVKLLSQRTLKTKNYWKERGLKEMNCCVCNGYIAKGETRTYIYPSTTSNSTKNAFCNSCARLESSYEDQKQKWAKSNPEYVGSPRTIEKVKALKKIRDDFVSPEGRYYGTDFFFIYGSKLACLVCNRVETLKSPHKGGMRFYSFDSYEAKHRLCNIVKNKKNFSKNTSKPKKISKITSNQLITHYFRPFSNNNNSTTAINKNLSSSSSSSFSNNNNSTTAINKNLSSSSSLLLSNNNNSTTAINKNLSSSSSSPSFSFNNSNSLWNDSSDDEAFEDQSIEIPLMVCEKCYFAGTAVSEDTTCDAHLLIQALAQEQTSKTQKLVKLLSVLSIPVTLPKIYGEEEIGSPYVKQEIEKFRTDKNLEIPKRRFSSVVCGSTIHYCPNCFKSKIRQKNIHHKAIHSSISNRKNLYWQQVGCSNIINVVNSINFNPPEKLKKLFDEKCKKILAPIQIEQPKHQDYTPEVVLLWETQPFDTTSPLCNTRVDATVAFAPRALMQILETYCLYCANEVFWPCAASVKNQFNYLPIRLLNQDVIWKSIVAELLIPFSFIEIQSGSYSRDPPTPDGEIWDSLELVEQWKLILKERYTLGSNNYSHHLVTLSNKLKTLYPYSIYLNRLQFIQHQHRDQQQLKKILLEQFEQWKKFKKTNPFQLKGTLNTKILTPMKLN